MLLPLVRAPARHACAPLSRKRHLWRSVVGVVSLWLWFFAIAKLPLATAVTLNYMAPIWMAACPVLRRLVARARTTSSGRWCWPSP